MTKQFPEGFWWGAATSSHQVEGGNTNDWSDWEAAGKVANNEQSGTAADSWNRYEDDFDVLEKLNLNAYRFSIEWSRIEPKKGKFDEAAIKHYRKMILSLRRRGIEPMVTLHHFTNPLWLKDWSYEENIEYFVRYVRYVVSRLGDKVQYWMTINEPTNMVILGFEMHIWPPGGNNKLAGLKAFSNFANAHNAAYDAIHEEHIRHHFPEASVGLPMVMSYFTPHNRWNPLDVALNYAVKRVTNHRFLKRVSHKLDFLGVNHYFTFHTHWTSVSSFTNIRHPGMGLRTNDMGWNMEPIGLYHVLMEASRYGLPLLVTENGLADAKDTQREWYIKEYLASVYKAVDDGAPVIGYLHWSLIDNFEWADGYAPRFGLAAVNFETFKRTIRPSAKTYAKIAKLNALDKG